MDFINLKVMSMLCHVIIFHHMNNTPFKLFLYMFYLAQDNIMELSYFKYILAMI
jgi:hypothetical protein